MGLSVLLLLNSDFLLGRHEGENRVDRPQRGGLPFMDEENRPHDHGEVPRGL